MSVIFKCSFSETIFSWYYGKLHNYTVIHTEQRTKIIRQALMGAEVMKAYGWEDSLEKVTIKKKTNSLLSLVINFDTKSPGAYKYNLNTCMFIYLFNRT